MGEQCQTHLSPDQAGRLLDPKLFPSAEPGLGYLPRTELLNPICSESTKTRACAMVKHSPCCRWPLLKGLELDTYMCKKHSAWKEVGDHGLLTDPGWEKPAAIRGHCLGHQEPPAEPSAPYLCPVCPLKPASSGHFFCLFIERATPSLTPAPLTLPHSSAFTQN